MRLTKKSEKDYMGYEPIEELVKENNASPIIGKLGQLEDIEEELGVDLLTLIKVFKDGVYIKINGEIGYIQYVSIFKKRKWRLYSSSTFWGKYDICLVKDYGKKWSLTKEELL